MSANKSPIASPAKGQTKDQKPSPTANSDEEEENRSMKSETDGQLSSDDSDEFVDVVVLGPSGAEEQPAKERKQHKQTTTHQQSSSSSSSPSKQQQQPTEAVPVQQQSPQQTQMDPPPQYQPTADSKQHTDPNQQHNQSWFSSSSLPSFLAATQAGSDEQTQNPSQHSSASALRVLAELRARLQPWNLFFRPAKFGLPPGLVAIGPRVKYNLQHFLSNYLCLFIVLLIYCILTSLLMLLTLIVLAGLCYTIYQRTQKGPVLLGGQEIPPSLLYTLALMVCIPLFYLANAGSVMYWVIGTGLFLMLAHSVFYASEEVPGQEFEVVTVVTA